MVGVTGVVGVFLAKLTELGYLPAQKPVRRVKQRAGLSKAYCERRLRRLRQRSATRSGRSHYMPFGGRFSVRMPRVSIRSRRARQVDRVCEAVVNGTPNTAVAER